MLTFGLMVWTAKTVGHRAALFCFDFFARNSLYIYFGQPKSVTYPTKSEAFIWECPLSSHHEAIATVNYTRAKWLNLSVFCVRATVYVTTENRSNDSTLISAHGVVLSSILFYFIELYIVNGVYRKETSATVTSYVMLSRTNAF